MKIYKKYMSSNHQKPKTFLYKKFKVITYLAVIKRRCKFFEKKFIGSLCMYSFFKIEIQNKCIIQNHHHPSFKLQKCTE